MGVHEEEAAGVVEAWPHDLSLFSARFVLQKARGDTRDVCDVLLTQYRITVHGCSRIDDLNGICNLQL
jgi:hypothetical protein